MHNHNHIHCNHLNVKFCSHCNVCYCVTCGMEWKYSNTYWYNTPYWSTTGGSTINVRDIKYDNVTEAHSHT